MKKKKQLNDKETIGLPVSLVNMVKLICLTCLYTLLSHTTDVTNCLQNFVLEMIEENLHKRITKPTDLISNLFHVIWFLIERLELILKKLLKIVFLRKGNH